MYPRSVSPPKWSINAEVTINHPNMIGNPGTTRTENLDRGIRMTYSFHTTPRTSEPQNPLKSSASPGYGFQRGNMVFTSTPRNPKLNTNLLGVNINDSGYNSEQLLSPSSNQKNLTENRKCRSTCSIVLSADFDEPLPKDSSNQESPSCSSTNCNRTQSLRCQHPSKKYKSRSGFYGCGDPWCYHSTYTESIPRFSPVPESCEEWSNTDSINKTCTSNTLEKTSTSYLKKPIMQDASSQTIQTQDQSTSPMFKSSLFSPFSNPRISSATSTNVTTNKSSKITKKYDTRHKTEPLPTKFPPYNCLDKKKAKNISEDSNDPERKPRTVHIDVYCTGSDADSDSSDSSNSDKEISASTPQTVYENNELRIHHKRIVDNTVLPFAYLKQNKLIKSTPETNLSSFASSEMSKRSSLFSENEDGISSLYPSQKSSYSTINDFDSSASNIPQTWSSMSTSSCTLPDYESMSTSWKDTTSDFESLFHNRATPITPMSTTDAASTSILPSDSFEYTDSTDKLRIKKMEELWAQGKTRKTNSKIEPKLTMQQQRINEYIEKRLAKKPLPKWEEVESRPSSTNESEIDWSSSLKRGDTVRRISKDSEKKSNEQQPQNVGNTNDLLTRASLFGTTLQGSTTRKLGHHIGPVRNPICTCDHCISYYNGKRARTRSVGDKPEGTINWKHQLTRNQILRLESKNPDYTDF
ncbi:dentin sialophosphoprotein isoform X2 [Chrysoperla carnea]|uniref:dentin sialophosphoprotein isoform X2 n=1 Tax=Chrysoperla carnea TaxID=189513 RepID=UPI001D06D0D1|nr:dentin sialophosphoprotein isoform X2 [Chrysoperla carnea]